MWHIKLPPAFFAVNKQYFLRVCANFMKYLCSICSLRKLGFRLFQCDGKLEFPCNFQ